MTTFEVLTLSPTTPPIEMKASRSLKEAKPWWNPSCDEILRDETPSCRVVTVLGVHCVKVQPSVIGHKLIFPDILSNSSIKEQRAVPFLSSSSITHPFFGTFRVIWGIFQHLFVYYLKYSIFASNGTPFKPSWRLRHFSIRIGHCSPRAWRFWNQIKHLPNQYMFL